MNPKQVNYLLLTVTVCLAFLTWGTIAVLRQVNDVNYHAPSKMDVYQDCMNSTGYTPNSGDCKAMAGGGK